MIVESRVLGVLNVESLELNAFTDDDTKLLEMLASPYTGYVPLRRRLVLRMSCLGSVCVLSRS